MDGGGLHLLTLSYSLAQFRDQVELEVLGLCVSFFGDWKHGDCNLLPNLFNLHVTCTICFVILPLRLAVASFSLLCYCLQ